jgi:ubiquinone/menaquinone biosynthesis C-methylase UbiE
MASPFLDPLLPLAGVLDPVLDPLTIRITRALTNWWKGPPLRAAQVRAREEALDRVAAAYAPQLQPLIDGVRARNRQAIDRYDALLAEAVTELRTKAEARAARDVQQRIAHGVDRVLYSNREEWLDDPSFDGRLRVRTLERLDRMNEAIGSYDAFMSVIAPMVERAREAGVSRPVVVDLASGHAMFAVLLALQLGAREGKVRVVATDLVPDYLDIGRAQARRFGMGDDAISFVVQDALDLTTLEHNVGSAVDVVCCTQSVHHFPPGFVARMLGEAATVARHGAIVVDGERNPFALVLVALVGSVLARGSLPFLHDSMVSMRRMYTEQELGLMGRLAPGRDGSVGLANRHGWLNPGHVWLASP